MNSFKNEPSLDFEEHINKVRKRLNELRIEYNRINAKRAIKQKSIEALRLENTELDILVKNIECVMSELLK